MAGYTRKNLRDDVEDMAPQFGLAPPGPDGLELLAFGGPRAAQNDAEMQQGWWAEQPY
ncbi:MAG TPA: hypothetical protein VMS63_04710 [Gaiellaceae bacterium]|jgi:hypothetical protein|nr:hypothetical protein [Gaiellaceae bacterium]